MFVHNDNLNESQANQNVLFEASPSDGASDNPVDVAATHCHPLVDRETPLGPIIPHIIPPMDSPGSTSENVSPQPQPTEGSKNLDVGPRLGWVKRPPDLRSLAEGKGSDTQMEARPPPPSCGKRGRPAKKIQESIEQNQLKLGALYRIASKRQSSDCEDGESDLEPIQTKRKPKAQVVNDLRQLALDHVPDLQSAIAHYNPKTLHDKAQASWTGMKPANRALIDKGLENGLKGGSLFQMLDEIPVHSLEADADRGALSPCSQISPSDVHPEPSRVQAGSPSIPDDPVVSPTPNTQLGLSPSWLDSQQGRFLQAAAESLMDDSPRSDVSDGAQTTINAAEPPEFGAGARTVRQICELLTSNTKRSTAVFLRRVHHRDIDKETGLRYAEQLSWMAANVRKYLREVQASHAAAKREQLSRDQQLEQTRRDIISLLDDNSHNNQSTQQLALQVSDLNNQQADTAALLIDVDGRAEAMKVALAGFREHVDSRLVRTTDMQLALRGFEGRVASQHARSEEMQLALRGVESRVVSQQDQSDEMQLALRGVERRVDSQQDRSDEMQLALRGVERRVETQLAVYDKHFNLIDGRLDSYKELVEHRLKQLTAFLDGEIEDVRSTTYSRQLVALDSAKQELAVFLKKQEGDHQIILKSFTREWGTVMAQWREQTDLVTIDRNKEEARLLQRVDDDKRQLKAFFLETMEARVAKAADEILQSNNRETEKLAGEVAGLHTNISNVEKQLQQLQDKPAVQITKFVSRTLPRTVAPRRKKVVAETDSKELPRSGNDVLTNQERRDFARMFEERLEIAKKLPHEQRPSPIHMASLDHALQRYAVFANQVAGVHTKHRPAEADKVEWANDIIYAVQTTLEILTGKRKPQSSAQQPQRPAGSKGKNTLPNLISRLERTRADVQRFKSLLQRDLKELPRHAKWLEMARRWKAVSVERWAAAIAIGEDQINRLATIIRRIKLREKAATEKARLSRSPKQYLTELQQKTQTGEPTRRGPTIVDEGLLTDLPKYWSEILAAPPGELCDRGRDILQKHGKEVKAQNHTMPAFTEAHLQSALKHMQPWKGTGWDRVYTYWFKFMTSLHDLLIDGFNDYLDGTSTPAWFTHGRTVMIPKNGSQPKQPGDMRPINCMPVAYKILTSMLERELRQHLEPYLKEEQQGCRSHKFGTLHQLITDRVVGEQMHKQKADYSVAYLDFSKAFDSMTHTWISEVLKVYGVDPATRRLIGHLMASWRVTLTLNNQIASGQIAVGRGILQGDALSPLLFILGLNPISAEVSHSGLGIDIPHKGKLNHLMYVDDWKLYGKTPAEIDELVKIVAELGGVAGLKLNEKKCATINISSGRLSSIPTNGEATAGFPQLTTPEMRYKYLGVFENTELDDRGMIDQATKETLSRVSTVAKLGCSTNKIFALINSWGLGQIRYLLPFLKWTQTDLDAIDRKIRKVLAKNNMRGITSGVHFLYLQRKEGGRGLLSIRDMYATSTSHAWHYIENHMAWLCTAFPSSVTLNRLRQSAEDIRDAAVEKVQGCTVDACTKSHLKEVQQTHHKGQIMSRPLHNRFEKAVKKPGVAVKESRNFMGHESWPRKKCPAGWSGLYSQSATTQRLPDTIMQSLKEKAVVACVESVSTNKKQSITFCRAAVNLDSLSTLLVITQWPRP